MMRMAALARTVIALVITPTTGRGEHMPRVNRKRGQTANYGRHEPTLDMLPDTGSVGTH